MNLLPSFEDFEAAWAQGKNQLVYARLAADLDTPVSLMLKLAEARSDTFMLESVTGGEVRGRYSVVGMKPDLIWQCHGTQSRINREARFDPQAFVPLSGHPLDTMRALIAESRVDLPEGMPKEILKHLKTVWCAGQQLRITKDGSEPDTAPKKPRPPRRPDTREKPDTIGKVKRKNESFFEFRQGKKKKPFKD